MGRRVAVGRPTGRGRAVGAGRGPFECVTPPRAPCRGGVTRLVVKAVGVAVEAQADEGRAGKPEPGRSPRASVFRRLAFSKEASGLVPDLHRPDQIRTLWHERARSWEGAEVTLGGAVPVLIDGHVPIDAIAERVGFHPVR